MMHKVCHICGDIGWASALLLCCSCETIAQHTYCIGNLGEADGGWICEFCEPRIIEISDSSEDVNKSFDPETPNTLKEFRDTREEEDTQNARYSQTCHTMNNKPESLSRDVNSADKASEGTHEAEALASHGSCGLSPVTEEDFYDPLQPQPDPIWMGGFRILGECSCTVSGILAHMSNDACEEASAVANSLPVLLPLDLVPKRDIWPVKFKKTGPTVDNIAVYFFPDTYRAERLYDLLVDDIIENELAMVASVNGVELLIFSSRELPEDSWRFQQKYFLWGMFRRKKKTSPQEKSNDHRSGTKTEAKSNKDSGSPFP